MSHLFKQPHKCVKCGHEFLYSPHDHHPAPTDSTGQPACPECWDEFLASVGLGYCTVAWTREGSAYDKAKAARKKS